MASGEPGAPDDAQEVLSFETYKKAQARISRRRLYPVTIFYTAYAMIVLVWALRSPHPYVALGFFVAAVPLWTLVEFMFHRFILHGRFGPGKGIFRKFVHERLDPLHREYHARPFDGHHFSHRASPRQPEASLRFRMPGQHRATCHGKNNVCQKRKGESQS